MLLIFAHRAEAQVFFNRHKLTQHPEFAKLFISSKFNILICDEGLEKSMHNSTKAITLLNKEISTIYNYGIAGSLNKDLLLNQLYSVRTIYCQKNSEMIFQSFSSNHQKGIDLISVQNRIMPEDDITDLQNFGDLVDREAWSIAFSASTFKHLKNNVFSYKVVSDFSALEDNNFCQRIKEDALSFSKIFYQHFQDNFLLNLLDNDKTKNSFSYAASNDNDNDNNNDDSLFPTSVFHRTFTQRSFINKHLQKLNEDNLIKVTKQIQLLKTNNTLNKKQRTQKVITFINEIICPVSSEIKNNLNTLLATFQRGNIQFSYDQKLESQTINLNVKLDHQSQINKLITLLEELPFQKLQSLLSGNE